MYFSFTLYSSSIISVYNSHTHAKLITAKLRRLEMENILENESISSVSSTVSSIFSTGDENPPLSSSSSGDASFSSAGGSGEMTPRVSRVNKCVGRSNKGVTWGFTSVIGRRKEMEDALRIAPGFLTRSCDDVGGCMAAPGSSSFGEVSPVHFFGVYDGHGGAQVAQFCEKRMHEVVAEELDRETVVQHWQKKWEAAAARSFERVDNEVLIEAPSLEMVGSTAVVIVLSGCQIIASNCGDSRAVLCRGTDTISLTTDHKPDREDELLRIEGQGGKVINWNGARVLGVLAMSRAIGDRYLRPWIIPVPEITFTTRSDDDECLILASDGLWDVMSNDEVGEVARRILRRRRRSMRDDETTPAAQVVADSLTEIALGRNSSDNISIIVVDLKATRKRRPNP